MAEKKQEEYFEEFKNEKLDDAKLKDAETKASKLGGLADSFLLLIKMAKDMLSGDFKMSAGEIAILVGAIIYVISPIDAIPDFIPFIGWADDIGVVGLALKQLADVITRYTQHLSR